MFLHRIMPFVSVCQKLFFKTSITRKEPFDSDFKGEYPASCNRDILAFEFFDMM